MTKALFLDFDGVIRLNLNSEGGWASGKTDFCPQRMGWLAQVCELSGAKVVVCSDWRFDKDDDAREFLKPSLHKYLHPDWKTPIKGHRPREIEHWLDEHPEVSRFAILDDLASLYDGCSSSIRQRLLLCSSRHGVVPGHLPRLLELLK